MTKQGVTLVELLVVTAIISLIGALVLVSVTSLGLSAQVNSAINQFLDIAKETRHNAVSVKSFKSTLFPSYGMYINLSSPRDIIVFADCVVDDNGDKYIDDNDSFIYDPSSTDCDGGNGYYKTYTLSSDVAISAIRTTSFGTTVNENKLNIEFVRPEPTIWISDSSDVLIPAGHVEIDITDTRKGTFTKTLIFWTSGQFAIDES